jgi:lipopolysaccharide transport protein LptA
VGSRSLVVGALFALGLSLTGETAQADPLAVIAGETLDLNAAKLDIDVEAGRAVLVGDVKAQLGALKVECDRVEIKYDGAPKVEWAKGTGGVRASYQDIQARAESVEVDVVHRTMTLIGGVRLSRGKGWVTAGKARLDLATNKVSLEEVKGSIPVETPQR